ncbi:SpoIIE family protein phosphatase [Chitinimonas arctica]|uniref:SpoIIE family protein phosphatase n=1 Tax=Chitinimonas arctica TaxID=2594795 RepID=A0A516SBQ4_9NEIS|nr:ATP-binding protein [Chitinimonas arctica]QDQ25577.1 SpoIIE family protein phosphatase [Chitinimonas arctica]
MRHHYALAWEVARRNGHLAFELDDNSQVGELRRVAVAMAAKLGFDETTRGRVALVATELGSNLVRYANRGRVLLAAVESTPGKLAVEMLSLDHGPGIADLSACMADGHSTGGTSGTGLGAVRRLSDEFDIHSSVPSGTVILARLTTRPAPPPSGPFVVGAVALALPGETACGDGWSVRQGEAGTAVLLADGLGHGWEAAQATSLALATFETAPFDDSRAMLQKIHQALRTSRGAAVALAQLDPAGTHVRFAGVGNIAGRLISGLVDRSLLSQHGTAGLRLGSLHVVDCDWPAHAVLVMHSDGLFSRWKLEGAADILQHHPGLIAAWLMREYCRGRDDASVVVVKRRDV